MTAALFNGSAAGPEIAWSRGLHYGDGVFRTCLIYASHTVDIEMQIDKITDDARRLGLAPPPAALLSAEAGTLAAQCRHGVLRIVLARGGAERGYRARATSCDRLLCRYPLATHPAACWERGISAARADFRLAAQPALAGVKHLNRLEQVLASRAWPEGFDELIVADASGQPVSGTRSNLFWVHQGVLRTPALDQCGVAGLMRDKVLACAGALGLPVRVGAGSWAELESADEAFVTNSIIGIWPLARLEGRRWRAPGLATRRLAGQLRHPRAVAA